MADIKWQKKKKITELEDRATEIIQYKRKMGKNEVSETCRTLSCSLASNWSTTSSRERKNKKCIWKNTQFTRFLVRIEDLCENNLKCNTLWTIQVHNLVLLLWTLPAHHLHLILSPSDEETQVKEKGFITFFSYYNCLFSSYCVMVKCHWRDVMINFGCLLS